MFVVKIVGKHPLSPCENPLIQSQCAFTVHVVGLSLLHFKIIASSEIICDPLGATVFIIICPTFFCWPKSLQYWTVPADMWTIFCHPIFCFSRANTDTWGGEKEGKKPWNEQLRPEHPHWFLLLLLLFMPKPAVASREKYTQGHRIFCRCVYAFNHVYDSGLQKIFRLPWKSSFVLFY